MAVLAPHHHSRVAAEVEAESASLRSYSCSCRPPLLVVEEAVALPPHHPTWSVQAMVGEVGEQQTMEKETKRGRGVEARKRRQGDKRGGEILQRMSA